MSEESTGQAPAQDADMSRQQSATDQARDVLGNTSGGVDFEYSQVEKPKERNPYEVNKEESPGLDPSAIFKKEEEEEEKPPEEEKTKEEELFSKRFSMLAKREQALLAKEKAMKQREDGLKPRDDMYSMDQLKEMLSNDPYSIYEKAGIDPDSALETLVQNPRNQSEKKMMSEIEKLNNKIDQLETKRKSESQNSTISRVKAGIKNLVESDSEKYELINGNDAHDTVFEVMKAYYQQNGKTLQMAEACDLVESHLDKELERIAKYKKFNRFRDGQSQTPQQSQQSQTESMGNKTINNQLNAVTPPNSKRFLSNEESLEHASKLIRWD